MGIFGTGLDTSDPFFRRTTDDDTATLIQWAQHTLTSRPGYLRTAPDQGCDLAGMLLGGYTPEAQVAIPAAAKAALERGRRVASATVTPTKVSLGVGLVGVALQIEIVPASGGPTVTFTHTIDPAAADYMIKGA